MSESKLDYALLIQEIEELIRRGLHRDARNKINSVNTNEIPRKHALRLGFLARRLEEYFLGVRILRPWIHPDKGKDVVPTDEELAAYAFLLNDLGALKEGVEVLGRAQSKNQTDILLAKAFNFFASWDYRKAIPLLKRYIEQFPPTEYRHWIGKINLAAAFVVESYRESADLLLRDLRDKLRSSSYRLLYGNALEISAQLSLIDGQFEAAALFLAEGRQVLESTEGLSLFFIKKWEIILRVMTEPIQHDLITQIEGLREEATTRKSWETLRDLDLYLAIARNDLDGLQKVLAQTPFAAFRRKAELLWGRTITLPPWLVITAWEPRANTECLPGSREQNSRSSVLDLEKGALSGDFTLAHQKKVHYLLSALFQDAYRPLSLGGVFNQLYPGEYFNPYSSPGRVKNVVNNLRLWIRDQGLPIEVKTAHNQFFLKLKNQKVEFYDVWKGFVQQQNQLHSSGSVVQLTVARQIDREPEDLKKQQIKRMRSIFKGRLFTAQDAAQILGVSRRTAQALIKDACSGRSLFSRPDGRCRYYTFSATPARRTGKAVV